jgi:hypothetical protein
MTLSLLTFSKLPFGRMQFGKMSLSLLKLRIMALSILTLSIMILSIMAQHNHTHQDEIKHKNKNMILGIMTLNIRTLIAPYDQVLCHSG